MTGIGAVTVSTAASGAAPQTNNAASTAKDAGAPGNHSNQAAVISQIAAQTASQKVAEDDKRDVSLQKRTEAGFSSNQDEPHREDNDESAIGSKKKQSDSSKLNLTV